MILWHKGFNPAECRPIFWLPVPYFSTWEYPLFQSTCYCANVSTNKLL